MSGKPMHETEARERAYEDLRRQGYAPTRSADLADAVVGKVMDKLARVKGEKRR